MARSRKPRASDREWLERLTGRVRDRRVTEQSKGRRMKIEHVGSEMVNVASGGYLISGLERDEPVFVIRARDAFALPLLALYSTMIAQGDLFDWTRSNALQTDVQRFAEWRRANAASVRDPD